MRRRPTPRGLNYVRLRGPGPPVSIECLPNPLIVKPPYLLYPARPPRMIGLSSPRRTSGPAYTRLARPLRSIRSFQPVSTA